MGTIAMPQGGSADLGKILAGGIVSANAWAGQVYSLSTTISGTAGKKGYIYSYFYQYCPYPSVGNNSYKFTTTEGIETLSKETVAIGQNVSYVIMWTKFDNTASTSDLVLRSGPSANGSSVFSMFNIAFIR